MVIKHTKNAIVSAHYLLFVWLIVASSCNKRATYQSPANYNLNSPYLMKLPTELADISGIAYYAKDNSIFAESDEKGGLYKISMNKPTDIKKWKFSHKKDFEDIVLLDSTFYVLNNDGSVISVKFTDDSMSTNKADFPENGKYEFESLYYDDKLQKLILLCKDCEIDKPGTTSAYAFDTRQSTYTSAFTMDTHTIPNMGGPGNTGLKPSAAAINPVTNELYILSSINKVLVVADRNGAVKKVYNLNPKIFHHPEGITFTSSGNMFISNEGTELDPPNILFYKFIKVDNQ